MGREIHLSWVEIGRMQVTYRPPSFFRHRPSTSMASCAGFRGALMLAGDRRVSSVSVHSLVHRNPMEICDDRSKETTSIQLSDRASPGTGVPKKTQFWPETVFIDHHPGGEETPL